jgi:general secretion pathway protein L
MNQILGFISEWGAVLLDSLPHAVQRTLGLGRRFVVLEPDFDGWILSRTRGAVLDGIGPVDVAGLADKMRRREDPVVLVLPEQMAMRSVLTLPGTARRSLEQVLEVEIERLTPFKARDVAVTREINPTQDGQIKVALTIVPYSRIEEQVAPLRAAGIEINHIITDRTRVAEAPDLSLIRGSQVAGGTHTNWIPLAVTLALFLGAVLSPFVKQELQLREIETRLSSLKPGVKAVRRLAGDVKAMEARLESLRAFSQSRVSMTSLLEETTRILPDDTWLVLYQFDGERLTLEGQSASATSLVNTLTTAPRLGDVRFRAPVTRDPTSGADRFRLSAAVSRP